jgi:hypothetical protein
MVVNDPPDTLQGTDDTEPDGEEIASKSNMQQVYWRSGVGEL